MKRRDSKKEREKYSNFIDYFLGLFPYFYIRIVEKFHS